MNNTFLAGESVLFNVERDLDAHCRLRPFQCDPEQATRASNAKFQMNFDRQ
jgi:hypothetical protein